MINNNNNNNNNDNKFFLSVPLKNQSDHRFLSF